MDGCNGVSTPLAPGLQLKALEKVGDGHVGIENHDAYRTLVESLMYASTPTRPDLAYSAGSLARHLHAPGLEHWKAAKTVLRYVQQSKAKQLILGSDRDDGDGDIPRLELYSDSDYAGDINTRKSTSGMVTMLAGGAVSWHSKLQKVVAQSTMEAEYVALSETVKEALWISKLMLDLTGRDCFPITIKTDNTAAIILAKNPENHDKAKHIDVRYHFIRDEVEKGRIQLVYVESKKNLADLLTKPLRRQDHEFLTKSVGLD